MSRSSTSSLRAIRAGVLPTLLYIHGGGWVGGVKETHFLDFLPYLEMGFAVVNVEYRMGRVALAPGAVEDCRCALRWVLNNAEEYGIDTGAHRREAGTRPAATLL